MRTALLAVVLAASPCLAADVASSHQRPHHLLTVRPLFGTSIPDFLGAGLTVHAIPWVDLEVGGSFTGFSASLFVRGGPRVQLGDWRDAGDRGWTIDAAALFGYRILAAWGASSGLTAVLTSDATYWFSPHFGLAVQLAGGAFVGTDRRVVPEARLTLGLSF